MIGRRVRQLSRYREVVGAFARNGLGFVVHDLGLSELMPLARKRSSGKEASSRRTLGQRIRIVLEELGPTFVKVGQIASTRPDLIPRDIIRELELLQDRVPPFSFEQARSIVEGELGAPLNSLFAQFDEEPLASASIGQVHYAVLPAGDAVAVKVQRPGIDRVIETDLEILRDLARLAEQRLAWAAKYGLAEMADEFAKSLQGELDYSLEGRHAERMGEALAYDANMVVPKVYWDYSTRRVLTSEYIQGVRMNELLAGSAGAGCDRSAVAKRFAGSILEQVLVLGFFHGDPHPGNLIILPGERIAWLDFGTVGRLTPETKHHFATLVIGLQRGSTDLIVKAVSRMGLIPAEADMAALREDVERLRDKYYRVPWSQLRLGDAISDLFAVSFRHRIRMPADLTLLGKTLLTMEGTVQALDPAFRLFDIAEPFGFRLMLERLRPRSFLGRIWHEASEYAGVLADLPLKAHELATTVQKGQLRMEIGVPELKTLLRTLDRISNRLSISVVLLAISILMVGLIVGSSADQAPYALWNIPAVEIGFGLAAFMFLWLLLSILKSGRF
ncbi:ABC1 kinase family protein [Paenibacillus ginsengihumi]|uniref:ABC1 kinase family protein n=1 Tax=Paenibacillus ginsengihumi TaxID=431596 RepID=UPI00036773BA|nr:AarF/ABC1/UbiB kinase family protein [Paenibacillus ginsengihumi]